MADVMEELTAALNNHSVTDEDGQVQEGEDTPVESVSEETEQPEAQEEPEPEPTEKQEEPEEDPDVVQDETTGKKFVPEKRFKEIYGKTKRLERELEQLRKQQTPSVSKDTLDMPRLTDAQKLENEIMFERYPEFNPESEEYDEELNEVAVNLFLANRDNGMTRLEAAKKAKNLASKITAKVAGIRSEALSIKREQADSGITRRVTSREGTSFNPDNASVEELEEYLRKTGNW